MKTATKWKSAVLIRPRGASRSDAALVRTGRYGDGWVGAWCSVNRYRAALEIIDAAAQASGRADVTWQHGYQPWVGVADSRDEARARVGLAMEAFYKVPFEQFERYTPYGTPRGRGYP